MGLDMYVRSTVVPPPAAVDFEYDLDRDHELFYWRKHADLHGWMEQLYRDKGGQKDDFNVTPVQLLPEDIDRLETDVKLRLLPHTTGFFFGETTEEDYAATEAFIALARAQFREGRYLYYTSWW